MLYLLISSFYSHVTERQYTRSTLRWVPAGVPIDATPVDHFSLLTSHMEAIYEVTPPYILR